MLFLIYWLIILITLLAVLICFLVIQQVNISNIRKQQEKINDKTRTFLKESNFNLTKVFVLNDYATHNQANSCKKFIAIDSENKKLCLIDYNKGSLLIVGFDEFLNYEIYENGSQQTFGGGASGFWTGIFGAQTNGMCKQLKLLIRLNRYDNSQVCYDIIFNTTFNIGINKSSDTYKNCISSIQEVVSFLEVIKNENNKN